MARFFAILCLTAVVGVSSAVPASESSRGGGNLNFLQCSNPLINAAALNCIQFDNNKFTTAIVGGAADASCTQNCAASGTKCTEVKFISADGSQSGNSQFKCCSTDGNSNYVNCGYDTCSANGVSGGKAGSICCGQCTSR